MKINKSQHDLLTLIDDHTKWEGDERPGQKLVHYWVPDRDWSKTLNRHIRVGGSGDASMIRGFMRNGFVTPMEQAVKYGCAITGLGMVVLQRYREANIYVNGKWPRYEECADCGSTGHDTGSDTCPGPDVQD